MPLPSVITTTIVFVVIMVGAPVMAFVPVVVTRVAAVSAVISRLIFRGSHEIHRPTARVVFTAVLTPVMRMLRWNVQVDRRWPGHARHGFDHDWLGRYQWGWRIVADLHLAVDTWRNLSRENDVDTQFTGAARCCAGNQHACRRNQKPVAHIDDLMWAVSLCRKSIADAARILRRSSHFEQALAASAADADQLSLITDWTSPPSQPETSSGNCKSRIHSSRLAAVDDQRLRGTGRPPLLSEAGFVCGCRL